MKLKLLVLSFLLMNTYGLLAQVRCETYMPAFSIDIDANGGLQNQKAKLAPIASNYPDAVNSYIGKVNIKSATSTSFDIRFNYSEDPERKVGIALGFSLSRQNTTLGLDTFHEEFKATDFKGNIFRQSITASSPILESISMYSLKIPLLLSYRIDFTKQNIYDAPKLNMFLTIEAGVVYTVQLDNTWSTNAKFNYEAIYDFTSSGNNSGSIYDNSSIPANKDLVITQSQYLKNNPNGNVINYFAQKNADGLSVGLAEKVKNNSGTFVMAQGNLGYLVDAAMNFKLSKKVFFKFGGYFSAQTFANTSQNNSQELTSKIIRDNKGQDVGVDYNSLMNSISFIKSSNYGITIGLKFFISSHSLLDFQ